MSNTTKDYKTLQIRELTVIQQNAIDKLVLGNNDRQTAEAVGVHRVTVTNWRLCDPDFRAALNQRRAEIWNSSLDRLRSLIPEALDVLVSNLEDRRSIDSTRAATEILRLVRARDLIPVGPIDPDVILQQMVQQGCEGAPDDTSAPENEEKAVLPFDEHVAKLQKEQEAIGQTSETFPIHDEPRMKHGLNTDKE